MSAADEARDTATVIRHGTSAGWNAHNVLGIPACDDCRDANTRYIRAWRRTKGIGQHHWPLTLPAVLADAPTLGAVLAQAWRA